MKKILAVCVFSLLIRQKAPATEHLAETKYFKVAVDPDAKNILLSDKKGNILVREVVFYAQYLPKGGNLKDTITSRIHAFDSIIENPSKSKTDIVLKAITNFAHATFTLKMSQKSSELTVESEVLYTKDVVVVREALIFQMMEPVTEVYRKNRAIDTAQFQPEYWLDKEGVKFGTGEKTFLIYHVPGISSLQLNTSARKLVVNLDYSKDHPFQHFPLRDSAMNIKEDLSYSFYHSGQSRKNSFSFHAGMAINFVPQLMADKNGYLSSFVFTEHADWTDLPSHKAVYFGSENISKASQATGGFVKNKIPVTKSVFYSNPDSVLNSDSRYRSVFSAPLANIRGTKGYLEFLKELQLLGNDICLHTPDQYTSRRELLNEAMTYMKENFNSVSWIDHGYNNGPKNNREAFVCEGLDSTSSSYAKDLWEKYGVKYFWNSYYEDFTTEDSLFFDFYGTLIHPYSGFGDAAPTPIYWKHPTRTGNFYSWPTRDMLEMHDPKDWSYHFSPDRLNDFSNQHAVKFVHCYPAGGAFDRGYWAMDSNKKLVVEPEFEKTLQRLSTYRDSGLINVTTVRDLLNHLTACENIRLEYQEDGSIKIKNLNDDEIKGISFTTTAKKVLVNKRAPKYKIKNNALVFWFNLKGNKSATIKLSN